MRVRQVDLLLGSFRTRRSGVAHAQTLVSSSCESRRLLKYSELPLDPPVKVVKLLKLPFKLASPTTNWFDDTILDWRVLQLRRSCCKQATKLAPAFGNILSVAQILLHISEGFVRPLIVASSDDFDLIRC